MNMWFNHVLISCSPNEISTSLYTIKLRTPIHPGLALLHINQSLLLLKHIHWHLHTIAVTAYSENMRTYPTRQSWSEHHITNSSQSESYHSSKRSYFFHKTLSEISQNVNIEKNDWASLLQSAWICQLFRLSQNWQKKEESDRI